MFSKYFSLTMISNYLTVELASGPEKMLAILTCYAILVALLYFRQFVQRLILSFLLIVYLHLIAERQSAFSIYIILTDGIFTDIGKANNQVWDPYYNVHGAVIPCYKCMHGIWVILPTGYQQQLNKKDCTEYRWKKIIPNLFHSLHKCTSTLYFPREKRKFVFHWYTVLVNTIRRVISAPWDT